MTWSLVTVMESPSVDLPSEVTATAQAALIRMGWQPPPTQEPTGSFLLPKGDPMPLTRHQADVTVRRLADQYYRETASDDDLTADTTEPRFGDFHRKLSWQIGADIDRLELMDILDSLDKITKAETKQATEYAEADLNFTVNLLLDRTNIRGPHILR